MPINLESLKANIKEYVEMGELAYKQRKYNASLMLYFKALVGICDYIIKRDLNKEPENHSHRFRILREYYPDLYRVVDNSSTSTGIHTRIGLGKGKWRS